jgi:hypothetical protein
MSTHDSRVDELVRRGRITPAEGERLRAALDGSSRRWRVLHNPAEYLSPFGAIVTALIVLAVSLATAHAGTRFDGAFDVHRVAAVSWRIALIDQIIAIGVPSLIFWIAGVLVTRDTRWQDLAIVTTLARIPNVLLAWWLIAVLPEPAEIMRQVAAGAISPRVMTGAISSLPFVVWMFVWLYRGFVFATGVGGAKAAAAFIVAVVVAEIASKLLFPYLLLLA